MVICLYIFLFWVTEMQWRHPISYAELDMYKYMYVTS